MATQAKVTHVGMDCHRKFSRFTARDAENRVVFRGRLEHGDRVKLRRQLSHLPVGTPVILESSFGWGWMSNELEGCGLEPHLANCRKLKQWRQVQGMAKSNKRDADLLSGLWLESSRWWEVWLAPQAVRDQREWLRYRMGLVRIQTMVKNRIHATLHRHGIINPFSDLFGCAGRVFLATVVEDETLRPSTRETLAGLMRLLEFVRGEIALVTRRVRREVSCSEEAELWRTLPGIGWILSHTIMAEVGRADRFLSSKRLSRYALVAPIAQDSGEETGEAPLGRHVGHVGRLTLKWAFIEAAHGAVKKSPRFREVFNRRTQNGERDKNQGYIAVARQLCCVGLACVKKGVAYRELRPPRPGERSPASAATATRSPALDQPDHPTVQPSHRRRRSRR